MSASTLHSPADYAESAGSNLSGMPSFLIDPASAAGRLFSKWFWLGPLLIAVAVTLVANVLITPLVMHVLTTQPPPPNVNPEAYQSQLAVGMRFQRYAAIFAPLLTLVFQALVLWGMASVVAVEAKYRQMMNLASGCSLITSLAAIAGVVVLKAKGEISTMAELRPPLGLDIFLPEGMNKALLAFVGYFSIFEVWWIVMMVLTFSAAYRVSKMKAGIVVAPLVLISLIFRVVAAMLQRS